MDFDPPSYRDKVDGKVYVWDPTSHTYVEGEDGEQPLRSWSGPGDNALLDPAHHTMKPSNPSQTGIMANVGHQFEVGQRVRCNYDPSSGLKGQPGIIMERADGDHWAVRRLNDPMDAPLEWFREDALEPMEGETHAPWDETSIDPKLQRDTPEQQEGLVRHASGPCPNCGALIATETGSCERCGYTMSERQITPEQGQMDHIEGPFPERAEKPNNMKTDPSFPTMSHRKTDARLAVSGDMPDFSHIDEERQFMAAAPGLDACPECGGPLTEHNGDVACHTCGLHQPIMQLQARLKKEAILPAIGAAAMAALRAIGPKLIGGIAGRAAPAVAAEAAPAAAGAAPAAAGAAPSVGVKGLMGKAMQGAAFQGGMGMAGPAGPAQQAMKDNTPSYQANPNAPAGRIGTNEQFHDDFIAHGEDDNPEHDGTQGFQQQHSDSPEFLKDVDGGGPTSPDHNEPGEASDEEIQAALDGLDEHQVQAIVQLAEKWDMVQQYAESADLDGSTNPELVALDEALEAAFPGYRSDDAPEGEAEDTSMDHDALEKVAARRPKMCPAHGDLVDASLLEGRSLMGQFAPANYGANYCKDAGFDGKCNFKPAMTTQKYWDDKDAEYATRAEQRALQQAQEAEQAQAEELAGTTLDPAEHDVDFDATPTSEWEADDTDMGAAEYAPGLSDAPSAVGEPMQVAAGFFDEDAGIENAAPHIRDWHAQLQNFTPGTAVRWRFYDRGIGYVQDQGENNRPGLAASINVQWPDGSVENAYLDHLTPVPGDMTMHHPTTGVQQADDAFVNAAPMVDSPYQTDSPQHMQDLVMQASHEGDGPEAYDFGRPSGEHHGDDEGTAVAQDDSGIDHGVNDTAGAPLREGSTYLMKNADYSVPDKVTIDKIAAGEVTYTIHTGQMDFQDHMRLADIQTEGFEFEPADETPAEGTPGDHADDTPVPTEHTHDDNAGNLSDFKAASRADGCTCDEDLCECLPKTANLDNFGDNAAAPFGSEDDEDEDSEGAFRGTCENCGFEHEPETMHTICPQCNHKGWTQEPADDKTATFRNASAVPDEHLGFQLIAGADFSPREQRDFIAEPGVARNLDRLDLSGTHYPHESNTDDDFLW